MRAGAVRGGAGGRDPLTAFRLHYRSKYYYVRVYETRRAFAREAPRSWLGWTELTPSGRITIGLYSEHLDLNTIAHECCHAAFYRQCNRMGPVMVDHELTAEMTGDLTQLLCRELRARGFDVTD